MTNTKKTDIMKTLVPPLIGIIGVIIGIFINQYFTANNIRQEKSYELKMNFVKEVYPTLLKIKEFAEIGSEQNILSFQRVYLDSEKKIIGEDKVGINFRTPSILANQSRFVIWDSLRIEIFKNIESIDPKIKEIIVQIVDFINSNPVPEYINLESYENSSWSKPETFGRWISLNDYLNLKIKNILELKD